MRRKIVGIEGMLAGELRPRLSIEILRQAGDDRIEDRNAGNGELGASFLELGSEIGIDEGEQNHARLVLDLGQGAGKLLRGADERIDMLDRLVVGIISHRGTGDGVEGLTSRIRDQMQVEKSGG